MYQNGSEESKHNIRTDCYNAVLELDWICMGKCNGPTVLYMDIFVEPQWVNYPHIHLTDHSRRVPG